MRYNIRDIIREIKFGFQRMFKGYSNDVFWSFDSYFLQIVPALKEFCTEQLKGTATFKLNPERFKIFTMTLILIERYENMTDYDYYKNDNQINKLLEYVGKNIGYFWD